MMGAQQISRTHQARRSVNVAVLRHSFLSACRHARGAHVKKTFGVLTTLLLAIGLLSVPSPAYAVNPATVNLGSAGTYSVVIGGAVTNAGVTILSGNLGISPAALITNTGTLTVGGTTHNGDAAAAQAYFDMQTAYNYVVGLPSTPNSFPATGGGNYVAGVYNQGGASAPAGTMTLDGQGDPSSVFIFQINGAFAPSGQMSLINGAQAGNVFWQVNGAFAPGANSRTVGTVMAVGAGSLGAYATLNGRVLVTAAGTFSSNTITTSSSTTTSPTTPSPSTVPGAPTGVSATAGNGQAVVSWTAPASNGGSVITGYTVTSSPGGLTATTTGATTATVTGLTNGTPYTFTVTATNATGTSPTTATPTALTPSTMSTAPGAPTGVSATAGNGQAVVSWTAPASNGGSVITGYTVTSSPGGHTVTTTGATTAIVTGLTNGIPYTFTVTATNATGTSPTTATPTALTPSTTSVLPGSPTSTVPGATPGATATAGNGQAVVSWTTPVASFLSSLPPVGGATFTLAGTAYTSTVTANRREGNLQISGDNLQMIVTPKSAAGANIALDSAGTAILHAGGRVAASGRGFVPGSPVNFYLLRGNTTTFLGSRGVSSDGTYAGSVPIPGDLVRGTYTLQVNALTNNTRLRASDTYVCSISLLVRVIKPAVKGKAVRAVAYFDVFSPKLTKSAKRQLDTLVKLLPTKSNNLVRVVGFVGPGGSVGNINALSKARTESVARYLRSKGVRGKYVLTVGGNASGGGPSVQRAKVQIIPNKGR